MDVPRALVLISAGTPSLSPRGTSVRTVPSMPSLKRAFFKKNKIKIRTEGRALENAVSVPIELIARPLFLAGPRGELLGLTFQRPWLHPRVTSVVSVSQSTSSACAGVRVCLVRQNGPRGGRLPQPTLVARVHGAWGGRRAVPAAVTVFGFGVWVSRMGHMLESVHAAAVAAFVGTPCGPGAFLVADVLSCPLCPVLGDRAGSLRLPLAF